MYDFYDTKIEFSRYNVKGKLIYKETNKYDDDLNIIERNEFIKGKLNRKEIYKYDIWMNRIERKSYNSKGKLDFKFTWQYDNKRKMTGWSQYNSNNEIVKRIVINNK